MRILIFIIGCLVIPRLYAQDRQREAVRSVVLSVFEGMRAADSAMVSAAFTPTANMYTITKGENGRTNFREGSLSTFLQAVANPRDEVWNEPLWDIEIKIDQGFAQVWASYAFYLDNQFSHCGVDAFHLLQTAEGWKIFQVTDTRKKQGCKIPEAVRKKFQGD